MEFFFAAETVARPSRHRVRPGVEIGTDGIGVLVGPAVDFLVLPAPGQDRGIGHVDVGDLADFRPAAIAENSDALVERRGRHVAQIGGGAGLEGELHGEDVIGGKSGDRCDVRAETSATGPATLCR